MDSHEGQEGTGRKTGLDRIEVKGLGHGGFSQV